MTKPIPFLVEYNLPKKGREELFIRAVTEPVWDLSMRLDSGLPDFEMDPSVVPFIHPHAMPRFGFPFFLNARGQIVSLEAYFRQNPYLSRVGARAAFVDSEGIKCTFAFAVVIAGAQRRIWFVPREVERLRPLGTITETAHSNDFLARHWQLADISNPVDQRPDGSPVEAATPTNGEPTAVIGKPSQQPPPPPGLRPVETAATETNAPASRIRITLENC